MSRAAELVARHTSEHRAIGAEGDVLDRLDRAHDDLGNALRRQSRGRAVVTGGVLALTGVATLAMARVAVAADVSPGVALLVVVPAALADAMLPLADAVRARARAEQSERRVESLLDQEPAVAARAPGRPTSTAAAPAASTGWGAVGRRSHRRGRRARPAPGPSGRDRRRQRVRQVDDPGRPRPCPRHDVGQLPRRRGGRQGLDLDAVRELRRGRRRRAPRLRRGPASQPPPRPTGRRRRPVVEALDVAGLGAWFAELPEGLATHLGSGGRGISGGERARLALARAVLSGRPVVLLDEPVAHLDHPTATSVMRDVGAALAGRTVVVVSHRHEGLDSLDEVLDLTPARPGPRRAHLLRPAPR